MRLWGVSSTCASRKASTLSTRATSGALRGEGRYTNCAAERDGSSISNSGCFAPYNHSLRSKGERLFGALPKFESLIDLRDSGSEEEWLSKHLDGVAREFEERVDVASIVNELEKIERFRGYDRGSGGSSAAMMKPAVAVAVSLPINVATETSPFFSGGVGLKPLGRPAPFPAPGPERSAKVRRTREEIEKEAKAQGAKGG